jgi:hypothetical protein
MGVLTFSRRQSEQIRADVSQRMSGSNQTRSYCCARHGCGGREGDDVQHDFVFRRKAAGLS